MERCVWKYDEELVEMLLERGADPNVGERRGFTALIEVLLQLSHCLSIEWATD